MGDIADQFDEVADIDLWMQGVVVFAAFLLPTVAKNILEGTLPFDAPDEAYGVAVILVAQYAGDYSSEAAIGGALYAVDKAAERFDVKQRVTALGE